MKTPKNEEFKEHTIQCAREFQVKFRYKRRIVERRRIVEQRYSFQVQPFWRVVPSWELEGVYGLRMPGGVCWD